MIKNKSAGNTDLRGVMCFNTNHPSFRNPAPYYPGGLHWLATAPLVSASQRQALGSTFKPLLSGQEALRQEIRRIREMNPETLWSKPLDASGTDREGPDREILQVIIDEGVPVVETSEKPGTVLRRLKTAGD